MFFDKAESFRKHVYCVHNILGKEGDYNIKGVWMWKGTEKLYCLDDHPAMEYYKFRKLELTNDKDFELIKEYWCKKGEEGLVEGEPVY